MSKSAKLLRPVRELQRLAPNDVLRVVYLRYYERFWSNPIHQLRFAGDFYGADGRTARFSGKIRVLRSGLCAPQFAVVLAEENGRELPPSPSRVLARFAEAAPVTPECLDRLVDVLTASSLTFAGRHHRLAMALVALGSMQGEYVYTRPVRHMSQPVPERDQDAERAYVGRVLLHWLRMHDVPIAARTYLDNAMECRAAGLGDHLPPAFACRRSA